MAEAEMVRVTMVVLTLSIEEARWVKSLLENPVIKGGEESNQDRGVRCDIYNALYEVSNG